MPSKESLAWSNWRAWLPLAIFVVALGIRLVGITWGLPNERHYFSYHPDEPVILGYAQQIEPTKLDFDPGFYNYGTLYLSILKVASDVVAGYSPAPDPQRPETFYFQQGSMHLAGRVLSALAGAGTAVVVFLMLRRRIGTFGALAAAALICVAPAHVVHSKFQTVDVVATFFLALSVYYALKLLPDAIEPNRNDLKAALLAGLFAGLSASTKYTGILVLLTVYAALALGKNKEAWKLAAFSTGTAVLAFLITTPGALLNSARFVKDFSFEMAHTSTGHGLVFVGTRSGFLEQFINLLIGIGVLATLMGIAGLIYAAGLKRSWALALLAFFIPYYILIGRAEVKFVRYTFPLYIGIAAGFGWVMAASHRRPGWPRAIAAFGLLAIGGEAPLAGLRGATQFSLWMAEPDVRDRVAKWFEGKGTAVGLVEDPWYYTPSFYPGAGAPRALPPDKRLEIMNATSDPKVVMTRTPGQPAVPWDQRLVTELAPPFIVLSSFEEEDAARIARTPNLPPEFATIGQQYTAFKSALQGKYKVDGIYDPTPSFLPHDLQYVHPTITIWKRKDLP